MIRSVDPRDVPVVILCGGLGTRIREASDQLPKPLVDIGGKPVLWHIMKTYSHYGFTRFILCLGYKGEDIKRYFLHYRENTSDFTLHMKGDHPTTFHDARADEDWEVTFVETGLLTQTGARLRRVREHLGEGPFMLTYGDGVGEVDVPALLDAHLRGGRLATVTGVHPTGRYGELDVDPTLNSVSTFNEKPTATDGWVSAGYFVFERSVADDYLDDDPALALEQAPLQRLARDGELALHAHNGFWLGMDTYRDWLQLNALWDSGEAPWKVWKD